MAADLADRCVLVKGFADFDVLPELLAITSVPSSDPAGFTLRFDPGRTPIQWEQFLQEWGVDRDHVEPGEFESDPFWFARDAVDLAQRMRWLSESDGPSAEGLELADIGRRPRNERTPEDEEAIRQALRNSIAEHWVTDGGLSVVDLLRSGAGQLAQSRPEWTWFSPGLLLIEVWALIYRAFENAERAVEMRDQLATQREAALALHGVKARGSDPVEPVPMELLADATAAMYLDQSRLAAGTGLRVTWARSTAMLLTYAGLLQEHLMGPVSYYHLPSWEAAHG